nr:EOG090X0AGI [Lepidurus arcticus]
MQFGDMKQADRKYEREAVERARRMGYDEMEMDGRNFVHMNPSNMPMGPRGMGMGMDNGPRFRGGPGFGPGPGMGPRRPGPPMGGPPQAMLPTTFVNVRRVKEAWNMLQGLVCVYKPAGVSIQHARKILINKLCKDFEDLEPSPPQQLVRIERAENPTESSEIPEFSVTTTPNLACNPLVSGPPIQEQDIRLGWVNHLSRYSSGVLVMGINKGNRWIQELKAGSHLSVYHIGMQLGVATDTHFHDGKVVEKATYVHINPTKLGRFLSSIEASHRRKMFDYLGVSPQSQTAYEMAAKGLIRPATNGPTLVYRVQCIAFAPPQITLEVSCINEDEQFLASMVHELGLQLKSVASCNQLRCIRYGYFDLSNALLKKHWTLEQVLSNVSLCNETVRRNGGLSPASPNLAPPPALRLSANS